MGESATGTPAIEGWFTTGPEAALLAPRCAGCGSVFFPPGGGLLPQPGL